MIAWVFVVVAFHASCGKFCKLSVHFIFAWYLLRFRSCCNFRKCILLACFPTLSVSFLHNLEEFFLREKTWYNNHKIFKNSFIIAQSICTHYSSFKYMGWFATMKKKDPKYGVKKIGSGFFFVILKKRGGSLASSLVNRKLQAKKYGPDPETKYGWCNLIFLYKFQTLTNYQVDLINQILIRVQIAWVSVIHSGQN